MKKQSSTYTIKRKYKGQPICLDPTIPPKENETGIHFMGRDRHAWISSYEPAIVANLLQHKHFKVEQLVTMVVNGCECVVGVVGRVPIGALRIGQPRDSDRHELIVSRR
ncbi:MAG: hypothetical protein A2Z21_04210 [Candidatus Fraserbacteria bacterium RBG_16_55_9]|uniref:Uncharacterized protein n=1 Tax=Fraserbacteria sp. (strain RBG_16_55_9) TaxID=1817864 RepID=A0A1F5UP26_FRAXR|nr:MAG: hypothetical protein A2Z21_04210 [Candidatus Fraserbacteria bacterium RBG_16_55_9]